MRRSPGIAVDEPAELEIIRMRRRHLKGVMAIERQVYPRPWSPNLFLQEMTELRNRTYLVARSGHDVMGYGGIMCYGDEGHVTNIAVDPAHHRHKIGTRLPYAVVQDGRTVRSNLVSSQVHLHGRFGGVVPEIAARAHLEQINPMIDLAVAEAGVRLRDVDAVAVTIGPGLVGALLVGVAAAKAV